MPDAMTDAEHLEAGPPASRRLVRKPAWVERAERAIAAVVPVHPNVISAAKLLVVTPLLLLALKQVGALPAAPWVAALLFLAFGLLDYLDGVVARHAGKETWFGRLFDRVTDYPVLLAISAVLVISFSAEGSTVTV